MVIGYCCFFNRSVIKHDTAFCMILGDILKDCGENVRFVYVYSALRKRCLSTNSSSLLTGGMITVCV